jgi:Major Facilitator Superfamily
MADPTSRAADPNQNETVSRDLLAQMDEAATGREHWKILITSGMGFFTDAYDLFIIGVVASVIVTEWHIASYQKSLVSSLALLTSAVVAIAFGHVADKLGRRKIYGWEVIVLAVGAIASAFSPSLLGPVADPRRDHDAGAVPAAVRRHVLLLRVRAEHDHVRIPSGDLPGPGADHDPWHRRGRREDRRVHRHIRADRAAASDRLSKTSAIVAGVALLGLLATITTLPEPKDSSLEEFTEGPMPASAAALGVVESRGTRPPAAA